MMILNNRDEISFFFFFPLSFVSFRSVTFARLHAVFGHGGGGGNDIVFCGLKTFGAHFCKRLKIDDLGFLFMQLSQLVPSYMMLPFCSASMLVHVTHSFRVDSEVN